MKILFFLLSLVCLSSCKSESSQIVNYFTQKDSSAPVLLEVSAQSVRVMKLTFNEKILPFGNSFSGYEVSSDENSIYVTLPQSLEAGSNVVLSARVRDLAGNTTGFSTPVWGYNPNPAGILINEFTLNSSDTQPQRTELYVTSGGSLAGLCLYAGTPDYFSHRVVLPSVYVNPGTFIVVWWINETKFRTQFGISEGTSATVGDVVNICGCTDEKLPASNGVLSISVSPSPGARILDCALYSKMAATKFEGFGSEEVLAMAKYVFEKKQWAFEEVDVYYVIDVSNSTSTRSVCRKNHQDTNSKEDWYVTVTGGATFGTENNKEVFTL